MTQHFTQCENNSYKANFLIRDMYLCLMISNCSGKQLEIIRQWYMSRIRMISNCSGKRSFSVLNRVKNQLRSSMGQKRLNSFALPCIENELLESIDTDKLLKALHCLNSENVSFECVHAK